MQQAHGATPPDDSATTQTGPQALARRPVEVFAEPIPGSEHRKPPPGKRAWLRWVPGAQTLMALTYYLMDDDAPTKQRFMIFISFLYLCSPVDIIPEAFLGPLGLADDFAVFIALVTFLGSATLRPYRVRAREWIMRRDDQPD